MQSNQSGTTESLVEQYEKAAALAALQQIIEEHLLAVEELRTVAAVDNASLLSREIDKLRTRLSVGWKFPQLTIWRTGSLSKRISRTFENVAFVLVGDKYKPSLEFIDSGKLSGTQRATAWALINADRQMLVSFKTLQLILEAFSQVNVAIKSALNETSDDPFTEMRLLFRNALLVYELNDFVVRYIENSGLDGLSTVETVHREYRKRRAKAVRDIAVWRANAQQPGVEESHRAVVPAIVASYESALAEADREWAHHLAESHDRDRSYRSAHRVLPTLKARRSQALAQLSVLDAIGILTDLDLNRRILEDLSRAVEQIELEPITPDRVSRLVAWEKPVRRKGGPSNAA